MKKHELLANDDVKVPKIYSIGFSDDPEITKYGPSSRNEYIIHYVLSGKGYFNGHEVSACEGFLITPGMYEEYFADEKTPWSFVWIISSDTSMKYFFERHGADAKTGIFKFTNKYTLYEIADSLREKTNCPTSSVKLSEIFLRIFNSCVESKRTHDGSMSEVYFEFSVNYVKVNLHTRLTVDDLCRTLGITQQYLHKIFKEKAGTSPKQYILKTKLDVALKFLCETDFTVTQISDAVGFENVAAFSKFFKKHMGLSPTEYKGT